jgi:predicted NodU family carbamoyl transferase
MPHDTAVALFEDGIIKAAIEEDKLARSKSTGLPVIAIKFCLQSAGATWCDLDRISGGHPSVTWLAKPLSLAGSAARLFSQGRCL